MCPHGRVHWRHLPNRIEPSVCGGDAALREITLTTLVSTCSAQNAVCWNTDDTDCTEKHQREWVIYKIVTTWNVMVTTQQTAVSRLFPVGLLAPILLVQYFYSAPQCSHCKRCTSYSISVRPSVCHTPVLCQNDGM